MKIKNLILGTKAFCFLSFPVWAQASHTHSSSLNWSLIVTVFLAVVGYLVQGWLSRKNNIEINRREIEQSNRVSRQKALDRYYVEKRETYFLFIDAMDKALKLKTPVNDDIMIEFRTKLTFWGSVEILQAFDDMENLNQDEADGGMKMLLAVDNLYREIRKDLGHDDGEGLKKGMLINKRLDVAGKKQINDYIERTNN